VRYYSLRILNPSTGKLYQPPGFEGLLGNQSYGSFVNGKTLPGAWDIIFDIPIVGLAATTWNATIQIWGISLAEISQANNFGLTAGGKPGFNISMFVGMQKGLPLANPKQAGLIFSGSIVQAFGNWINVDMTLDIVAAPVLSSASQPGGIGTLKNPKNITLNWQGQPLSQALPATMTTAFPGVKTNIAISSDIVAPTGAQLGGAYPTLEQLGQYLRQVSQDQIKTPGYAGVSTWVGSDGSINISDNTQNSNSQVKQIEFTDLIGQPTWIESPFMQFKTVMRSDLNILDKIKMPPAIVTTTAASQSSLANQRANFQGEFLISSIRHVGAFRNPSADAWVTIVDAAPVNPVGT
jgi:hypothetical protein